MALIRLNNQSISSVTALPSAAKTDATDVVLLNTITLGNQGTANFTVMVLLRYVYVASIRY